MLYLDLFHQKDQLLEDVGFYSLLRPIELKSFNCEEWYYCPFVDLSTIVEP